MLLSHFTQIFLQLLCAHCPYLEMQDHSGMVDKEPRWNPNNAPPFRGNPIA